MAYLTVGLVALVVSGVAATLALFLINRDRGFKEKVKSLFSNYVDTEASKDYQDLCRQRMQRKDIEKVDPVTPKTGPVSPPAGGPGQGKRSSPLSNQSSDDNGRPVLSSRSSTSSWSEEPVTVNMDISTGHMILTYMEDFLKNKNKLDKEWESLVDYEADPCATTVAKMAANVKKNRNVDLVPYDHSRVVLNDLSNVTGSDYINASTITDHDPRNPAYIASQGPLADTAADFWQMIWEQGTVTIVMLTRLMETGLPVCARYWPEEGSEVYHNYEVHLVSEHIWCTDFLVRSFYLKNLRTNETRTVTQFHYLSWTENGLPPSAKTLLDFRRKVNKSFRGKSCPIAVHCSDGVGRTGTYCLIDMVLNRMANGAKEIDIAATLEHIRDQRMGLVRTKAQFEFVLKAVAEEVTAILKALQGGPAH
ncbi:Receptor-type tyrosine-protein phosphatase-like N [Halotydeus destructor]|nr:Receptor-type tyrosine-protein phosphatase-like N [Halotydeus destructor]